MYTLHYYAFIIIPQLDYIIAFCVGVLQSIYTRTSLYLRQCEHVIIIWRPLHYVFMVADAFVSSYVLHGYWWKFHNTRWWRIVRPGRPAVYCPFVCNVGQVLQVCSISEIGWNRIGQCAWSCTIRPLRSSSPPLKAGFLMTVLLLLYGDDVKTAAFALKRLWTVAFLNYCFTVISVGLWAWREDGALDPFHGLRHRDN